jgi:hypothetical protein
MLEYELPCMMKEAFLKGIKKEDSMPARSGGCPTGHPGQEVLRRGGSQMMCTPREQSKRNTPASQLQRSPEIHNHVA